VLGTSDIFAAGLSLSSIDGLDGGNGTAPGFISVTAGQTIAITASGTVFCCDTASSPAEQLPTALILIPSRLFRRLLQQYLLIMISS
jgi:hypothetical protein